MGGGGEFCLRTVFELWFLQVFLLNKLGIIQVNIDKYKYTGFNHLQYWINCIDTDIYYKLYCPNNQ